MDQKKDNRDVSTSSMPGNDPDQSEREEPLPAAKPSQAEGDRETIEEDLRQKEAAGDL